MLWGNVYFHLKKFFFFLKQTAWNVYIKKIICAYKSIHFQGLEISFKRRNLNWSRGCDCRNTFAHNHMHTEWCDAHTCQRPLAGIFLLAGASEHHYPLTCSPSWYWTAACMASSSLSTRSFQALFRESQAEFNYDSKARIISVTCLQFSTTFIKQTVI